MEVCPLDGIPAGAEVRGGLTVEVGLERRCTGLVESFQVVKGASL